MAILLQTKPGINGANTLSIPKDWDSTWFRKFIANSLKGADVRNAVGSGGIKISGTIASPYATIGFASPVTLPGPVTITGTTGDLLTIGGAPFTGQLREIIQNTSTVDGDLTRLVLLAGATNFSIFVTNVNQSTAIITNGPTGAQMVIRGTGNIPLVFGVNNQLIFELNGSGATAAITGWGPTAAAMVDMTPDTGTFTGTITGCTATVTGTVTWSRIGNLVTMRLPSGMTGTSNTTAMTMTGIPAAIQPVANQVMACSLEDNSTNVAGYAQTTGAGLTFSRIVPATGVYSTAGFTAANVKGPNQTTFSYILN